MSDKPLVVTAFDEKYALLGAALLASLTQHAPATVAIRVLDLGLRKSSLLKLKRWVSSLSVDIEFVRVTPHTFTEIIGFDVKNLRDLKYYNRLLAPYMFQGYRRILYLDADTICVSGYSEIFKMDLSEKLVGACRDIGFPDFGSAVGKSGFKVVNNHVVLGFAASSPYFNSGVLLIDAEKWVRENISLKVLDVSVANQSNIFLYDQYGLNVVLHAKWIQLDSRWNHIHDKLPAETVFRHFAKLKPTQYVYNGSDREIFFNYLDRTPFRGFRPGFFVHILELIRRKAKKLVSI
jgi:lipopolysaccharide biosynthesis glycosyltransferase